MVKLHASRRISCGPLVSCFEGREERQDETAGGGTRPLTILGLSRIPKELKLEGFEPPWRVSAGVTRHRDKGDLESTDGGMACFGKCPLQ